MRNSFTIVLGVLIALVMLAYMFAFTVRYDQAAVLTTFNRAVDPVTDASGKVIEAGSVKQEPGLYFRWPWPVQQVEYYTTRLQILEDQLEELQTADRFSLVMRTYVVWRIKDPLAFFRGLRTTEAAEVQLQSMLRSVRGIISRYAFTDMVNPYPERLKLREIESQMLAQIQERLAQSGYGIEVRYIGIRRMMLPEGVTESVFERMKETRLAIAARAREEGGAQAAAIRSEATAASKRILAFAEERALKLRAEGDAQAAKYYDVFNKDQELAAFLRRIQTLRAALPGATVVLPVEEIAPEGGLISPQGAGPVKLGR
ncbi:MAG: protease modulator HflC [Phycisphaeraceae bacterium]|nr:protease modulator HflC [Phycisphaeraceae bacterium]